MWAEQKGADSVGGVKKTGCGEEKGAELKEPLPVSEPAAPGGHQGEVQLVRSREGRRGLKGGGCLSGQ